MRERFERLGDLTAFRLRQQAAIEATAFIQELAKAAGASAYALAGFERRYPQSPNLPALRQAVERTVNPKAAVGAMTTTNSGVLLPAGMGRELIELYRPSSVVDRLPSPHVPADLPIPVEVTGMAGGFIDEGRAKPLTVGAFDTTTVKGRTAAGIIVVPVELTKSPQAVPWLSAALSRGIGTIIGANFATSIVDGLTPVSFSGDPAADLRALLAAYVTNGGAVESAVVLMSSANAVGARLLATGLGGGDAFADLDRQGGSVAGVPAICSDAIGDSILVVDASRILLADQGELAVDIASHVTLEMSDAPTSAVSLGSPDQALPTTQVSMFQTNSVALRIERFINWRALDGAVAFMPNADYLETGSPA